VAAAMICEVFISVVLVGLFERAEGASAIRPRKSKTED
jgi:hypothetical protein